MDRQLESWATGVPGLDLLLTGGLSRNALVAIVGPSGAGKTVLACQILFQAVQQGSRGLILTAYSEDHGKLLAHLRPFTFFTERPLGDTLTLMSLSSVMGTPSATATSAIVTTIRESGARMVVLDGFQGIADQVADVTGLRQVLASLATQLSYLDVTVLLTLTGSARDAPTTTGLTSADVVLGLHYSLEDWQHRRRVEVLKQRGHAHLAGAHSYTISGSGITIFPRLETRVPPPAQPRPTGRVPFQLPELDELLGGGLTAGTTTLLVGAPGVGKTTLGLVWALRTGPGSGPSLFLNFEEQLPAMQVKADFLGLPLAAALAMEAFHFLNLSPVELNPDALAARLLEALTPTTQRVVIDNLRVLEQALGARAAQYLAALQHQLYAAGVSVLLLLEIKPFAGLQVNIVEMPLSVLADNMVIVQQVEAQGAIHRVLAVLKMRFSGHDTTLRELVIDAQGVRVLAPPQSAAGVLTDAAEASGLTAPPTPDAG
jgi:circadian clock protein KaiC